MDDPVALPIDGVLDLHTFRPQDVKSLVPDYCELCRAKGIIRVRIIHGKGTGTLRETVHSILKKMEMVDTFHPANEFFGGWGATIVILKPLSK